MAATACDTSATDLWELSATGSPSGGYIRRAASMVISATERQRVELALLSSGSAAARRVSLSLGLLYTGTGCAAAAVPASGAAPDAPAPPGRPLGHAWSSRVPA